MSKKYPIVSIIVPVFNNSKYIKKCIDSLLAQNVEGGIEIVCVDDGSVDESGRILDSLSDKSSIITVIHQKNCGRSVARNVGLEAARGKYIIFVDGDDRLGGKEGYDGNEIQALISSMAEGVDFSIGKMDFIYEANQHMEESDRSYYRLPFVGKHSITPEDINVIHCSACTKCFDRNLIERYRLRFPEGLNYEDAYWSACYLLISKAAYGVEKDVYTYYRHPSGIMNATFNQKNTKTAIQHAYIAENILKFAIANDLLRSKNHNKAINKFISDYFKLALRYCDGADKKHVLSICKEIIERNGLTINSYRDIFCEGVRTSIVDRMIAKFRKLMRR